MKHRFRDRRPVGKSRSPTGLAERPESPTPTVSKRTSSDRPRGSRRGSDEEKGILPFRFTISCAFILDDDRGARDRERRSNSRDRGRNSRTRTNRSRDRSRDRRRSR